MSDQKAGRKRNREISGQFSWRLIAMLESPAYIVLSRASHKVLARIEIELGHHGGKGNGALIVTYEQFVAYGLHRHAIAPAIRELSALGFLVVTIKGSAGNSDYRQPSKYRLTYRHTDAKGGDPTDDWKKVTSIEQAEELAKRARLDADQCPNSIASKKQKPSAGFRQFSVTETGTEKGFSQ